MNKKRGVAIVILVLIVTNVFFAIKMIEVQKESERIKADMAAANAKLPVIEFNRLFVEKVLQAEGEVSFDARLELENKVRELKDAEILNQWNSFVNSKTQTQAQNEVKGLLGLLAKKMSR